MNNCFVVFLSLVVLFVSTFSLIAQPVTLSRTLRDASNSADYIVITPNLFAPELDSYVRWRGTTTATHKGLRTFVATLSDINKEFYDSTKPQAQAEAIRAFLSNALQNWRAPKPLYIMLVGSTNILPAYRIKVTDPEFTVAPYIWYEDSIPMDHWYTVNSFIESFNNRPQASIGRVPARNVVELRRVLQKIRSFEEFGNWAPYNFRQRFTSILDDGGSDGSDFANWQSDVFSYMGAKTKQNISNNVFSYRSVQTQIDAKQQLLGAINGGSPVLMYFGHGAPDAWSGKRFITTDDVWNSFSRAGRPFMFSSIGCSQNYDKPGVLSIIESMMLLDAGGAVMSLASSGYSNGPFGKFYLSVFWAELLSKPGSDIGSAQRFTNDFLFETALTVQDNLYRRFALLGDPAMVPFTRIVTSVNDKNSDKKMGEEIRFSVSPNPADAATLLTFTLAETSRVRCEVVTLLGQTVFMQEMTRSAGLQQFSLATAELPQGVYLCRISTGKSQASTMLRVVR